MHDPAGQTRALLLIRMAAERIRHAHEQGTLDPITAADVRRAFVDLGRLGPGAPEYVDELVRVGAAQLVAAQAAGGERAAEVQAELAGSILAAWTILRDRGRTAIAG